MSLFFCPFRTAVSQNSVQFKGDNGNTFLIEAGDYHYRSGDYQLALSEYYQYVYTNDSDSLLPGVYYRMALTCKRLGLTDQAKSHYRTVYEKFPRSSLAVDAELSELLIEYDNEQYLAVLQRTINKTYLPYKIIAAYTLIKMGWLEEADSLLGLCLNDSIVLYSTRLSELKQNLADSTRLPGYKKWLATASSVILPGSGRFYFKQYKEGVFTFLNFALLGWISWYHQRNAGEHASGTTDPCNRNIPVGFRKSERPGIVKNTDIIIRAATTERGKYMSPALFLFGYYLLNIYTAYYSGIHLYQALEADRIQNLTREFPLDVLLVLYNPYP